MFLSIIIQVFKRWSKIEVSKYFILLLLLSNFLYAIPLQDQKTCSIDKNVIYSILMNEGLKKRVGYGFIISFNNSSDVKFLKKTEIKSLFINNRTLDCKNEKLCAYILNQLRKANIINLDIGAFQINYRLHKLNSLEDYFDIDKSYLFACKYIEDCVKQYGNNFKAYACYHSRTPKFNEKYQKNLKINYEKVNQLLQKK